MDPAHFGEVFEDEEEKMVPVFMDTFTRTVPLADRYACHYTGF